MALTPKKIYEDLKKKDIDKLTAADLLIDLIEADLSIDTRLECSTSRRPGGGIVHTVVGEQSTARRVISGDTPCFFVFCSRIGCVSLKD